MERTEKSDDRETEDTIAPSPKTTMAPPRVLEVIFASPERLESRLRPIAQIEVSRPELLGEVVDLEASATVLLLSDGFATFAVPRS